MPGPSALIAVETLRAISTVFVICLVAGVCLTALVWHLRRSERQDDQECEG